MQPTLAASTLPTLTVKFFISVAGNEPVRDFLLSLDPKDRIAVGTDMKTVQFGWPLGMPLVRKMDTDLWEVRSTISSGIVRILFTIRGAEMVLLHAFVKKSARTPQHELDTANSRKKLV